MNTSRLVFEIGTEELPAIPLHRAGEQFVGIATEAFAERRIQHGELSVFYTPRRITLIVDDVAHETEALEQEFRGPSADIAFDEEGNPSKAALGFARGKGLTADDLEVREVDGKRYVYAVKNVPPHDVAELLVDALAEMASAIEWPKSQRWGRGTARFARPVRWVLALFGDRIVPVEFAGLTAANTTRGHRLLADGDTGVASADEYLDVLNTVHVVLDVAERDRLIREGVAVIERETRTKADLREDIYREVLNLVEFPTVLLGRFDEEFLEIPAEIITDAMLEHQRYFPLYTADGQLTNGFIIVSNGDPARADVIVDGNERVVRARLSDAAFFYQEDSSRPLDSYLPELERVTFQEELGSVGAKAKRISRLAEQMALDLGLPQDRVADVARAGLLAKADLVTQAVVEFTSLQGVMGGYYAERSGETEAVSRAISEHYHPRYTDDVLPESIEGKLVALADKLDTIAGIFAIGKAPTGSSDPYALRRAAIGALRIVRELGGIDLGKSLDEAFAGYADQLDTDRAEVTAAVRDFVKVRLAVMMREAGYAQDVISAVTASGEIEPLPLEARARALQAARAQNPELFEDLAIAFKRAHNLVEKGGSGSIDESAFTEPERTFVAQLERSEHAIEDALAADDMDAVVGELGALRGPVDDFFEAVMIMVEDETQRENRLALLDRFLTLSAVVGDIGQLAAE